MSPTRVRSLIGGRLEEPGSDEVDPIYDPATGETIAMLVGRENSDPSCCHRTVLVDETAEQVSSTDFIGGTGRAFLF